MMRKYKKTKAKRKQKSHAVFHKYENMASKKYIQVVYMFAFIFPGILIQKLLHKYDDLGFKQLTFGCKRLSEKEI